MLQNLEETKVRRIFLEGLKIKICIFRRIKNIYNPLILKVDS